MMPARCSAAGSLDVASGARSDSGLRVGELQARLEQFWLASVQAAGQSEALGEDHGRILDPVDQSVQQDDSSFDNSEDFVIHA